MRLRLAIFGLVCVTQLVWAGSAIWQGEVRREAGRVWRFRTAPVDPADLVRGRYVQLAFQQTAGPALDARPFEAGEDAYALLAEDDEGFARVVGVAHDAPRGDAYLAVRVQSQLGDGVRFGFPVDRFYLPEAQAPVAERLVRAGAGRAWAEIRVHEGQATLLDVVQDGVPLGEAAAQALREQDEPHASPGGVGGTPGAAP